MVLEESEVIYTSLTNLNLFDMKIIQSFAEFDEGSYYLRHDKNNKEKVYLNFYSMLLSVLTLQKYYGHVTMYCNQKAHDSFIKYLPYNKIIILENKNTFTFWNYYKVDVIRKQTSKFIHVDPDVFIFDDLFSGFINSRKYDILIQDVIPEYANPVNCEVPKVRKYLKENGIMDSELCDGKAYSNGVVGMTIKTKKEFIEMADGFKNAYLNGNLKVNADLISMISEELALYLVGVRDKLRVAEILPYDDVVANGARQTANEKKYTHMWGDSKFNPQYIEVMKLKIIKEFPEYSDLIKQYEAEIMDNVMI